MPRKKLSKKSRGRPRKYLRVTTPKERPLTAQQWYQKLKPRKRYWRTIFLSDQKKKKVVVTGVRVRDKVARVQQKMSPERWLLIEHHSDETVKYYLSSLPAEISVRRMIHLAHSRYKVEQGYQYLKEELGMDQYEGRFWSGFHHHITLCFMAYDFLVLMKRDTNLKKNPSPEYQFRKFIASHAA